MKVLLTGANGFVGKFVKLEVDVIGLPEFIDIRDLEALTSYIEENTPDYVVHLAAQSFVPRSFENPRNTFDVNFLGTFNLLSTLERVGFQGRFLYVSSSDVYGIVPKEKQPILELQLTMPRSPYAVSKVAAEALCYQHSISSQFECIIARPFNHIGPGQSEQFVISNFAKQLVEIKLGLRKSKLNVGDIDVYRDFTDVRDVVRAYKLLLNEGANSEIYNICSGTGRKVRDLIEIMIRQLNIEVNIVVDENRLRKSEQRYVSGNYKKLAEVTGWSPNIDINDSIADILEYWENNL